MHYHETFTNEYRKLRDEVRNQGREVISKNPIISEIGEMTVDIMGNCRIDIKGQENFDFYGFFQYTKQNSFDPALHFGSFIIDEAMNRMTDYMFLEEREYHFTVVGDGPVKVSLSESKISDQELIIYNVMDFHPIMPVKEIARITRNRGLARMMERKTYDMTFWDVGYFPDFMKLLFQGK